MGNSITSCIKIQLHDDMKNNNKARNLSTINIDDYTNKNKTDLQVPTNMNLIEVDLTSILDQMFILCESGVASTIQFLINTYPNIKHIINETRTCCILDTKLELTLLHLSSACGHVDIVNTLLILDSCVDVNKVDSLLYMSALHFATILGQNLVIETLCKNIRVNMNEKNVDGKTALHIAVESEYVSIIESFLRIRPNLDLGIKDFDGNTIFHIISYHPNVKIMKLLVNHISLIHYYQDYFDSNNISHINKQKNKMNLLETKNYHEKTALQILFYAIDELKKAYTENNNIVDNKNTNNILNNNNNNMEEINYIIATTGETLTSTSNNSNQIIINKYDIDEKINILVQCYNILQEAIQKLSYYYTFPLIIHNSNKENNYNLSTSSSYNSIPDSIDTSSYSSIGKSNLYKYIGDSSKAAYSWSPQNEMIYYNSFNHKNKMKNIKI